MKFSANLRVFVAVKISQKCQINNACIILIAANATRVSNTKPEKKNQQNHTHMHIYTDITNCIMHFGIV